MGLLRVEITRFATRRAIVLLLLAGALVAVFAAGTIAWDTRPPSKAEIATASAQADLAAQDPQNKAEVQACQADPGSYLGPGRTKEACAPELLPSADSLLPRSSLSLYRVMAGDSVKLAALLVALALIAGATYAGADWASDSISNQLLFAPRRLRMWATKGATVVLLSGLAMAVVYGGFWLALLLIDDHRGASLPDSEVTQVAWQYLRGVGLAMGAALGGYALTMLFRHTVATLALLFAYAAGGEVLLTIVPIRHAARFSVGNNVFGWLKDGYTYFDRSVGCRPFQDCDPVRSMSHLDALWFLAALLAVAVVVSALSFRRRDV